MTTTETAEAKPWTGLTMTLPYRNVTGIDDTNGEVQLSESSTATFRCLSSINSGVLLSLSAISGSSRNATGTGAIFDALTASLMPGEYDRLWNLMYGEDIRVELDDLINFCTSLTEAYSGGRPTNTPAA